ncbi:Protein phosphatase 2C (PP2C)-like domain [Pseudocohnilembus persalinus]|uniref:Protein phosphatase 2C (PP2C)-like domain n=1 Tax=Pseudocohnilembus persalinus TaxID=266149 RepID=A0A0V0QK74_PSEPJ|nr:Protein phosphatase 2C (PP2C)-like domain [Pseudocohnilembus persalinus]|eukprot:KRX02599.1 Protein phosphatase 2C (PP2C)-like domain [Pseudocohnilembus persalinus]
MSRKNNISDVPQSEQITMELLKYQNKCLVSQKQDNLNKIINLQNEVKQLKLENQNHTSLYTNFWSAWRVFSIKLENINEIIKQQTDGQQKLQSSFKKTFDILLDIQNIPEQIKTATNEEFNKTTQNKCQDFVKQFETIYVQFQIEHKQYMDLLISKYEYYNENTSIEDSLKKAYTDAIEAQNKIKELSNFLQNEKYKFMDFQNSMEIDQVYIKLDEVQKLLEQEILSNYQNLNQQINKLLEDQKVNEELNNENYVCSCGQKEIDPILKEEIQHFKKIQQQLESGQLVNNSIDNQKNKDNNNNDKMELESNKEEYQQHMLSKHNENLTTNEKLNVQAKQIKDLIDEKSHLQRQLKQLQMEKTNLDEQFINSKLFNNLCQQGEEIEEEIRELIDKNKQENQKLQQELENKINFSKNNMQQMEKEIEQLLSRNQNSDISGKLSELQAKTRAQEQQIFDLEYVEKNEQLKVENSTLKAQMTPEVLNIDIKYPKDKVQEVLKQYPYVKEMINFMKQRDEKSNKYKKINEQYLKEIKGLKSQTEQYYSEVDFTQQGFDEKKKENTELEESLKNKDNQLRSFEHEKVKEKMSFQQEIESYKIKIEADKSTNQSQIHAISELQKQIQNLEKEKQILQTMNLEYQNQNQSIQDKIEALAKENQGYIEQLKLIQQVKDSGQIINQDVIKENEKLEQQLKENTLVLKQNMEKLNNSQDDYLKYQLQEFNILHIKLCLKQYYFPPWNIPRWIYYFIQKPGYPPPQTEGASPPSMQRNNSINNNLWQKRSVKPPKTSSQITSQFIDSNKDFLNPKFANEDEISKQKEIELEYNYSKELNHFHLKKSRKIGKDKENRQNNDNSSDDESYTNSGGYKNNRNRLNSQSLANLQLNSTKLPKLQTDQQSNSKRSYTPISQANKVQLPLNQNGKDLNSPKNDSDKKDQDENNKYQKSQKQVRKNHIVQISHLSKAGANLLGTKTNQDNFLIKKNLNGKPERYLLCVFDGHGQYGHQVSAFLKNTLVSNQVQMYNFSFILVLNQYISIYKFLGKIENNFQRDLECEDDEFVKSSLNLSFLQTSQALLESSIEVQYSGSTCVCVLIINNTIWSANVGDSRAVISRGLGFSSYKIEELTEDQKVDSPVELQRILAKGGRAEPYRDENGGQLGPYRVWLKDQDIPGLAMARSFGDIVATEAGVISTPEIKKFNMTEEDRYIIIASDGVWEFINSQQASNMVQSYYIKNQPDQACSKLVKESISLWKQNDDVIDDITAVIAFFKRPQKGFQKINQIELQEADNNVENQVEDQNNNQNTNEEIIQDQQQNPDNQMNQQEQNQEWIQFQKQEQQIQQQNTEGIKNLQIKNLKKKKKKSNNKSEHFSSGRLLKPQNVHSQQWDPSFTNDRLKLRKAQFVKIDKKWDPSFINERLPLDKIKVEKISKPYQIKRSLDDNLINCRYEPWNPSFINDKLQPRKVVFQKLPKIQQLKFTLF